MGGGGQLLLLALAALAATAAAQTLPAGWGSGEIDGKTYYYHNDSPGEILWDPPPMDEPAAAAAAAADAAGRRPAAPGGGEEAAPTAKKELFTLQVNVTGAETEGGVVPLTLHEGEAPGEVAAAFARANGLPDVSRDELTVAILQYAKQNGFVTPAFSIPITLPPAEGATEGETAALDWFPGDQASSVAADFAVKHNLDGTQRLQLVRGLIKEARVRGLVQPIFTLNVALPLDEGATEGTEPKRVPLDIYDGDDLDDAASEFVTRHSLPDVYRAQIRQGLRARAKTMELIKPVFELGVTLLSGAREVLKVYDGDNVESVAIDFAQTHDLAHDEREALIAAVEEQASARKLLPPLLFKLPVKVGDQKDPWIAQLYVHQGDVPAQIAASFVRQRHLPARPPSSCFNYFARTSRCAAAGRAHLAPGIPTSQCLCPRALVSIRCLGIQAGAMRLRQCRQSLRPSLRRRARSTKRSRTRRPERRGKPREPLRQGCEPAVVRWAAASPAERRGCGKYINGHCRHRQWHPRKLYS